MGSEGVGGVRGLAVHAYYIKQYTAHTAAFRTTHKGTSSITLSHNGENQFE